MVNIGKKTIREMLRNGDFPEKERDRKKVEEVVFLIRQAIFENKFKIWGKEIKDGQCFAREMPEDIFNGLTIPRGRRTFFLVRNSEDLDFIGTNLNGTHIKEVCSYSFTESQDRYFDYLMAKQGAIRTIRTTEFYPSAIEWHLITFV